MTTETERSLESIGRSAYESIVEMVAALECDYGRLEEIPAQIEELEEMLRVHGIGIEELSDPQGTTDELLELRDELAELKQAAGECTSREEAEVRILEDALSVEVRSGWVEPGVTEFDAEEFMILLATGGPAVRIIGELGQYGDPSRARLQVQDWFTPWTEYLGHSVSDTEREPVDQDVLLTYCRCFYFGEG